MIKKQNMDTNLPNSNKKQFYLKIFLAIFAIFILLAIFSFSDLTIKNEGGGSTSTELDRTDNKGGGSTSAELDGQGDINIIQPRPLLRKDSYSISTATPPYITYASFDPLDIQKGETQTVAVKVENATQITSVEVTMIMDDHQEVHELQLVEGVDTDGTWQGSWQIGASSGINNYQAKIEVQSQENTSEVTVTFR
jgi:hypothetical protein